jgi:ABC-2 type transport system ATP-binding protein
MSEMALTADHLLVIARGRIIADASTDEFVNGHSAPSVRARAIEQDDLVVALRQRGAVVQRCPDGSLTVTGLDCAAVGGAASAHGITLIELAAQVSSLEEAFFDLTRDETDYHASPLASATKGN